MTERIVEAGALKAVESAMERHIPGKKLLLVCDDAVWMAAGQALKESLAASHEIIPHSLGRKVKPLLEHAHALIEAIKANNADGLIAVGGGTINDITKHAAHMAEKPYICVPTAASMNGYSSANVSLEQEGFKSSHPASPPKAVIADVDILIAAPKRMSRAGLGDVLCRSTVECDRLLSHFLLGTPYEADDFAMLRKHEQGLLGDTIKLTTNDRPYITKLMHALLDAGDAMAKHGSSNLSSQGEHMIVHTCEMMYGVELVSVLHGELVAIATSTMAQLQHKLLLQPKLEIKPMRREASAFTHMFGKLRSAKLADLYNKKVFDPEQAAELNKKLETEWPKIKEAIGAVMTLPKILEKAMMVANIPVTITKVGIDEARYQSAVNYAYLTRDRFTFLDLAAMRGRA